MRDGRATTDRYPTPRYRDAVILALAASAALALYLSRTSFHLYPREDTIEAVVAAEALAAGRGHTTRVTSPSVLTFLDERDRAEPPWPNLLRSPLPCMMIAALARFSSQPIAVALSSGVFFILSVPLIYLIADRLGGRAAGVFAAITYILSRSGLWFGVTGLSESSTIFALAGIVYCMMLPAGVRTSLVAGGFAAIGYLGRSTFTIWAVPIIVYLAWHSRRDGVGRVLLNVTAFGIPLAISVLWWGTTIGALAGDFGASGQPDIVVRVDTDLYPGRSPALTLEHWGVREFIIAHPMEMARKAGRQIHSSWPWLINIGAMPLLVAFFFVEAFIVLARGKRVQIHWLIYALLLLQMLLLAIGSRGHGGVGPNRYLDPFGPIAAAIGAAFAVELLRERGLPMGRAIPPMVLVVLLTALPILFDMAVGPFHSDRLRRQQEIGAELERRADPEDVLASTSAAADAWTSGLHAIYLPMTPVDLQRMRRIVEVDWIRVGKAPTTLKERTEAWESVIDGHREPAGFRLVHRFEDGSVLLKRVEDDDRRGPRQIFLR